MSRLGAEALLLLVTVIWGGTFAVIKTAIDDISPSAFVLTRFAVALTVAVIIWPGAFKRMNRQVLGRGLALGFLFGMGFILQSIGLAYTTASTSAFITGTMVVFVPFVFRAVEGTRVRPLHMVTVGIVTIGLWLFTQPEVLGINGGDILTLVAAVFWAAYVVFIDLWTKDVSDDTDTIHALVILQFVATIVIAGISVLLLDGPGSATTWSWNLVAGIAYCAILATVFTTWAQTRFQHYTHPVRAGIIYAMEPIVATTIAWIALNEAWSSRQAVGAFILVAALVVPDVILARKKQL